MWMVLEYLHKALAEALAIVPECLRPQLTQSLLPDPNEWVDVATFRTRAQAYVDWFNGQVVAAGEDPSLNCADLIGGDDYLRIAVETSDLNFDFSVEPNEVQTTLSDQSDFLIKVGYHPHGDDRKTVKGEWQRQCEARGWLDEDD